MSLKVNKNALICGAVLIIEMIWMQKKLLWPSLSGTVYQIVYYMKYFGSFSLLAYSFTRRPAPEFKENWNKYVRMFIPLFALFLLVQCITAFTSPAVSTYGISYWTRSLALILDKVCVLMMVYSTYRLCGTKSIDYMTSALIIDGIVLILLTVIRTGVGETLKVFLVAFGILDSTTASSLLEVSEYTFAIGVCLIYYLFFRKKDSRSVTFKIVMLIVMLILGQKRIAFGAIIVAGLFALLVHRRGLQKATLLIAGIAGVVVCVFYTAICYNGDLMTWLSLYGIDVMGRDTIYSYFTARTEFSVSHIGWGLASVSKFIENMSRSEVGNMVNVRGIHNDILKVYIEMGFGGALFWHIYHWLYFPRKMYNKFGRKYATLFLCLIIYAFITYFTDNTENYFGVQVMLWLIPLAAGSEEVYDTYEQVGGEEIDDSEEVADYE